MMFPLTMTGYDRTYLPPRSIRTDVGGPVTAWDLFRLEHQEISQQWASATLDSLVAAVDAEGAELLGCTECEDTGFYGIPDTEDPDMLVGLARRLADGNYERLAASGVWEPPHESVETLEVLSLDLAADLASAITAGACGLLRRWAEPRAFLPPAAVVAAAPLHDVLMSLVSTEPPENTETPDNDWITYAVVDAVDQGAVFDVIRIRAAGAVEHLERWDDRAWVPDDDLLTEADLPLVRLTADQLADTQAQLNPSALVADAPLIVSPNPKAEKLRRYWTTGRGGAKIRWTAPGNGDWYRCVRHLSKYMGLRAKGYCSNLHKRATGVWPGSRLNRGLHASGATFLASPEESLLASVQTGRWGRNKERMTDMPLAQELLADGIYYEGDDENAGIMRTLVAGGFPVAPPDKWFADPELPGPTPMVVDDDGRVYGHIATWDVTHIGMAGSTRAPHSPSNYAYFRTGAVKTEGGNLVSVGHLTLSGGHADTRLDHQAAVKHYDDTNSAVADVAAGEDQYGIWAAGALRPDVTPEQVRAFRASPPSGDWRVIGGNLELVAACCVNVPGFVNVRAEARVASGAVLALVAAGARPLVELKAAAASESALLTRLTALESQVAALAVPAITEPVEEAAAPVAEEPPAEPVAEEAAAEPELTDAELARAERIARARGEVTDIRRRALRARVHSTTAAGKVPPQFLAQQKKMKAKADGEKEPEDAADKAEDVADNGSDEVAEESTDGKKKKQPVKPVKAAAASTIKGTDSFPISDVASLKKAIQAFGRAGDKDAAKKHISSMAFKLKRPDLIPANWKS